MSRGTLRKLISLQTARLEQIELTSTRLRERARDSFNLDIITTRIETLNRTWKDAQSTHGDIVSRGDAITDPYIVEGVMTRLQVLYEDTIDFLLTMRSELNISRNTLHIETRSNSDISDFNPRAAKLPKLDLPSFSGRYEDWENFCDLFTTLVHDAPRLADATKLQYLKSCLTGTAAELVKDVATTNVNYITTWESLKARFHNPRLIVYNHIKALFNIPYLKKESAPELRAFADEAQRIVRALSNLKMPVESWDVWFVYILGSRLDPESLKIWESEMSVKDRRTVSDITAGRSNANPIDRFPKFKELAEFLENRAQAFSMIAAENNQTDKKSSISTKPVPGARKIHHAATSQMSRNERFKCPLCSGPHPLHKCYRFRGKTPHERRDEIRRLQLCFNCFGTHKVGVCTSNFRCTSCNEKHHSLIHLRPNNRKNTANKNTFESNKSDGTRIEKSEGVIVHAASISAQKYSVILATAQFSLIGPNGEHTRVRALLDQGSETSLVSDSVARLIRLEKRRVNVPLIGLGSSTTGTARHATRLTIQSLVDSTFRIETDALVLPKLTSQLPARRAMDLNLELFAGLKLADPQFYQPDSIDVILGADVYGQLLRSGLQSFPHSALTAQDTALGWIISGPISVIESRRAEKRSTAPLQVLHCATDDTLNETLQRFWTLEDLPTPMLKFTNEEEICEKLFKETHFRDRDGHFIVRLPVKSKPSAAAAETRRMAVGTLNNMHRRFNRDSKLADGYRDFMSTYEQLGHMSRVPEAEINNPDAWYLPHHAVVQASPSNWKIRVVFDASRKTHKKECLNDFLLPGPALQRDLSLILLNWRQYKFVFTADIVKMFRQIGVVQEDQELQRIVWAPSPTDAPVDYRLTTVTYGTSCAPYLAIRTLLQLADSEKSRFPLGSRCLNAHTYVDDTFAGADELSEAVRTRQELVDILTSAGIKLDKWAANHPALLPPRESQAEIDKTKVINADQSIKTLGVYWNPAQDEFRFTTLELQTLLGASTKRSILSNISRLFDPLGWLSPITVNAKILMQDIWILKCSWDAPLPLPLQERWIEYCTSLSSLPALSIHRWLGPSIESIPQIHGFSDASSRAFAAAVYIRKFEDNGHFRVTLLTAKSKVAPVKTVSIPNLELCGAALLVKLIKHVCELDFLKTLPIFAWTDSQIVLTWLKKHPCNWKTFVANRVSYIQTELPNATWSHVPTKENPADLATRGCKPMELINTDLWWFGPSWLSQNEECWPKAAASPRVLHVQTSNEPDILGKFSTLTRLIRVVAYCLRPIEKLRRRKERLEGLPDFLTASELSRARTAVIKLSQAHAFATEIKLLQTKKGLPKRHYLLALNPYIDQAGILRVGGRLTNSNLTHENKHPPILPHRSALSRLFVKYAHRGCLHGGPTLTSNLLSQHAWILGRNRLVKTHIHNCIACQRVKPRLAHQMMGNLPAARVTPSRPFSSTGLDYAGPIQIRTTKGRGYKSYKGYIVLFVCFATRAVHLEAVSDLTAQGFIAAYKRFVGRRGICRNLHSDNATNFQAADKELQAMFKAASEFYRTTASSLANDGTTWNFIPPNSPHYGGLWEAGVKSIKHHLKRVIGDKPLTFEELSTLLVEIEACLNSRPLCPLSSDIDDLQTLTPSHFLFGTASALLPDEAPPDVPENRLDRLHLLQAMRNNFWYRWSREYLQHLQERSKWRGPAENFAVGQLVLVRDDRYPPSKWPLARVIEVHYGADNLVRVVTIKTANSTLRRHIARLSPLSLEQDPQRKRSPK